MERKDVIMAAVHDSMQTLIDNYMWEVRRIINSGAVGDSTRTSTIIAAALWSLSGDYRRHGDEIEFLNLINI